MAYLEVDGFDAVIKKLEKLSKKDQLDEIAKKAVNAALPTLEGSVRGHIHPREVSGNANARPAEVNSYGVFGVITVTGRDRHGYSAFGRAMALEYGTRQGKGAKMPWRDASATAVKGQVEELIKNIVDEEMECD